jgi:hypothetical protein
MPPDGEYLALRGHALNFSHTDLKLHLNDNKFVAYGVIMETGFPEGVVTVVSFATGEASYYLSSGGGVIGGGEHETIRNVARRFVDSAQTFLDRMSRAVDFPLPANGWTHFTF